jgi:hypothetical protein
MASGLPSALLSYTRYEERRDGEWQIVDHPVGHAPAAAVAGRPWRRREAQCSIPPLPSIRRQDGANRSSGSPRQRRAPNLETAGIWYDIHTMARSSTFVTSRLGVKSQTVLPKEVRAALGVSPGD